MLKKVITIIITLFLCLFAVYALADHSTIPKDSDMNDTQALDKAVELFCAEHGINEDILRGHWYCWLIYYDSQSWIDGYSGSVWDVEIVSPEIEIDEYGEDAHPAIIYYLNATTGELLEKENWYAYEHEDEWLYPWNYMFIPTKDQMQPTEALHRAQELLQETIKCDNDTLNKWYDYMIRGCTDTNGKFWYHVEIGFSGYLGGYEDPFMWNVYLDANTGEIIWQSDPVRFAKRYAISKSGISWYDWYDEQIVMYEELWGNMDQWDYLKEAAFEEHCGGHPSWPEPHRGLPREDECTYAEACAAALAWLAEQDGDTPHAWTVKHSVFYVDPNNRIHYLLPQGITENEHLWALWFTYDGSTDRPVLIYIDPATCEVTAGPRG